MCLLTHGIDNISLNWGWWPYGGCGTGPMGLDVATASLESPEVLPALWDLCLPAAQTPQLLTHGSAINASPSYLQLQL